VTSFCGRAPWSRKTRRFRTVALALVTLALLPFTRPFPTCPVSTFFEDGDIRHPTHTSPAPTINAAVRADAGSAAVPGEGEFKEDFAISPATLTLDFGSLAHPPGASAVRPMLRRPVAPTLRL
jgi:hypothetical protein